MSLTWYNRTRESVLFFVGDNTNLNPTIARNYCLWNDAGNVLHWVGFVGCASHRLNLAVEDLLASDEWKPLLNDVANIMYKIWSSSTLTARLEAKTPLRAVKRNGTRWTSAFKMISRYVKLVPFFADPTDVELHKLSLPTNTFPKVTSLLEMLTEINVVMISLQSESVDLLDVRIAFDELIARFGFMRDRLKPNSDNVDLDFRAFENGIVKVLQGDEANLLEKEKQALKNFEIAGKVRFCAWVDN